MHLLFCHIENFQYELRLHRVFVLLSVCHVLSESAHFRFIALCNTQPLSHAALHGGE